GFALCARGLEVGAKRRADSLARLETRNRFHPISLDRLQRGFDSVRSWSCLADFSASCGELSCVDPYLQVEETVRTRVSLRWTTLHSSPLAHVDRFSWYPGRLHEQQGNQLLRKQSSSDLCAAGVCDAQSVKVCGLWPV